MRVLLKNPLDGSRIWSQIIAPIGSLAFRKSCDGILKRAPEE